MKNLIKTIAFAGCASLANLSMAADFVAPENLMKARPIELCAHYTDQSADEQKRIYNHLDKLGILSHKDYDMMQKGQVVPGSSMCGMYMTLGKPLDEQGMQIRPLVYKVVHVYEDSYIVTQSGMVMEVLERKEGELPPSLNSATPKVAPPPMLHK